MTVVINVKADFRQAIDRLRSIEGRLRDQVIARTLNRLADGTKTEAVRGISRTYNLTATKVRERIKIKKAFAAKTLSVEISVPSRFGKRALNLISFGARELKRGGVSVKIRRDRAGLKSGQWFILTNTKTGGTFVAKRTGAARGDIDPVRTVDVGQMFNSRDINEAMLARIRRDFGKEFERQFKFATQRR